MKLAAALLAAAAVLVPIPARAEPAAVSSHGARPRIYAGPSGVLGATDGRGASGAAFDLGVRAFGPLYVHARVIDLSGSDDGAVNGLLGNEPYHRDHHRGVAAGPELRHCDGPIACLAIGVDVGAVERVHDHVDGVDRIRVEEQGAVVAPHLGLEVGGRYLAFRAVATASIHGANLPDPGVMPSTRTAVDGDLQLGVVARY